MSFDGNLLYLSKDKMNWTAFPIEYISANSYSVLLSGQDFDSARDANGNLFRNALDNKLPKVEFDTKNLMDNKTFAKMMSLIENRYINKIEKSLYVKCYVPETDGYVIQKCYVPDITASIYLVDTKKKIVKYNSTRIAFIGYGKGV